MYLPVYIIVQGLIVSHYISFTILMAHTHPVTDVGMVVIIVVCVGFLLFMIILGVIRIRTAHRRTQVVNVEEKQEMEWDNSELNITVNPLQKEVLLAHSMFHCFWRDYSWI